jgi:hypothetical protein
VAIWVDEQYADPQATPALGEHGPAAGRASSSLAVATPPGGSTLYTIRWTGLEPNEAGWSSPSDTNLYPARFRLDGDTAFGADVDENSQTVNIGHMGSVAPVWVPVLSHIDHLAGIRECRQVLILRFGSIPA